MLVDVVSKPFVNSHMNIKHFKDSADKITKRVFYLIADLNNDVFSSMREATLAHNPLVISKSSVRLANNFVRGQLTDNLLSMDQV